MVIFALQLLGATASTPVLTRLVGIRGFGRIALSVTILQIIVPITSLALQSGIQRIFVQDDGPRRARGLLFGSLVYSLAITAVLVATAPFWSGVVGLGGTGSLVYLTLCWGGLSAVALNGLSLLRSQDRFGAFCVVSLLQSVVCYGAGIASVAWLGGTAIHYLYGMLSAQTAAAIAAVVLTRPAPRGICDIATQRFAFRYCLPLIPTALAAFVLNAGDRIVVQHDLGSVAVARYQVAYSIGSLAIILLGTVNQAWAPMFFRIKDDVIRWRVLAGLRDQVFRLLAWSVLGLAIGAPIALRLWAPPSYHPGGLLVIVVVVAASAVPFALYIANVRILLWHKETGPLARSAGLAAVANVVLNIALVPYLHILGSAVATLICYCFLGLFTSVVARRLVRLPVPASTAVVEVMVGCLLAVGSMALPTTVPGLIVRGMVCVVCLLRLIFIAQAVIRHGRPDSHREVISTREGDPDDDRSVVAACSDP
jgi:O-antigen/teichoic acid export membrane protein